MVYHLQAFSANYVVTITQNNRIKIWQAENMRHNNNVLANLLFETFENNHLHLHYTTLTIFEETSLLALGDRVGRIVLFNLKTGKKILEIAHTKLKHNDDNNNNESAIIDGGHSSRVNSLQFVKIEDSNNNTSLQLLSVSNDRNFCRWKLNEQLNSVELVDSMNVGEVAPTCVIATTNICHNVNNNSFLPYLIIGCNNIVVHDIVKKKIIASYIGHASIIRHFKLSKDNRYLLSNGQDRFIYVWKLKMFFFFPKNKKNE